MIENADGRPVDYVNAAILSLPDSLATDGATCLDGKLQIETKATGDALLRLSVVGYADKFVSLTLQGGENNLGAITLEANTTLQAVTVSAHRPTIVSKADRTIVNVEGSVLSSALDGADMLKKTPGLTTDAQGNTVVFGKGAPKIYIDDREVQSPTEIKMLNPQNIKSIEIIDNPSAAYDAEGSAVVLIHTTKRDDAYFVRLGGTLQEGRHTSGSGFAEGYLSEGKFNADLHYGYSDRNGRDGTYGYYTPDDLHNIFQKDGGRDNDQNHEYYAGVTYNPTPKHTIGIQSNGYLDNSLFPQSKYTWSDDPAFRAFHTYTDFNNTNWQVGGTLFYNWAIDSLGQSFKFVADATKLHTHAPEPYYNVLDGAPIDAAEFMNKNDSKGTDVLYSLRADYVKPIGKVWTIATGAKYYSIGSNTHTIQTGSTELDQTYKSREWNLAGYFSITTRINNKISLQYGLRAEYNHRRGWNNEEQYINRSTLDWFPNALFQYAVSDNFNFGISYTKRLARPSIDELDPSIVVADSLLTRMGNPDLKSLKSHVFQLTFSFLQDFNVRASYSYNVYPTDFNIVRDVDNPQILNVRYVNRDHASAFSVSVGYNKDLFKWWTTSTYVGIAGAEYKYIENDIEKNNSTPRWNINTTNTFHLPWKLEWDVGFYWNSAGSYNVIRIGAFENLYTTLRRDFLDGALSVRISANDLFHKSMGEYQKSVLPGKHANWYNADSRYVVLNITYKFGKSTHQYRSQSGSQEEQGRL